jgi:catalase
LASSSGQQLPVDHSWTTMPLHHFDAVLVPGGALLRRGPAADGDAAHFVLEGVKHCKALCLIGESAQLLRLAGCGPGGGGRRRVVAGHQRARRRASRRAGLHRRHRQAPPLGPRLLDQVPA